MGEGGDLGLVELVPPTFAKRTQLETKTPNPELPLAGRRSTLINLNQGKNSFFMKPTSTKCRGQDERDGQDGGQQIFTKRNQHQGG